MHEIVNTKQSRHQTPAMRGMLSLKLVIILMLFLIILVIRISVREIKFKNRTMMKINPNDVQRKSEYNVTSADNNTDEVIVTKSLKYILQWTNPKNEPFVWMGVGQSGFIDRNCSYTNCFVTSDQNYLGDYTKFDVIVFAGPEVVRMKKYQLPQKRSLHQKFVFGSMESSDYYPICSNMLNSYFNWTWTFRMDSDAPWGYIAMRDAQNKAIGPKSEMHWIKFDDMDPVNDELKMQLKTKTKAAAWFVSNCKSKSKRENFVNELQIELKKYNLTIDVYGGCGPFKCPKNSESECDKLIKRDYYFYLAFENSFSVDYVTEKLLRGLKNMAVPIVFGAANYTRFMPDGIYLNARELGFEKLADKMNQLIKNPAKYAEYFRWHKYYSYHNRSESVETNDYCRFCSMLSEDELVQATTVYNNFKQWWNPPGKC